MQRRTPSPSPSTPPSVPKRSGGFKHVSSITLCGEPKTPEMPDSAFASPPASGIRPPLSSPVRRAAHERELVETPKTTKQIVDKLCSGETLDRKARALEVAKKILIVLMPILFVCMVVSHEDAICVGLLGADILGFIVVSLLVKRRISKAERNRPIPNLAFPPLNRESPIPSARSPDMFK